MVDTEKKRKFAPKIKYATMAKYLDPKADLTFKKVFGEHPNLMISFLNALLPLPEGKEIVSIDYLPTELVPETPLLKKNSIVDVRCKDVDGRYFIVEMQMEWQSSFKQRMLFNASKVYVRQLKKGENYDSLQPVYTLSLINDKYEEGEDFYHHYQIVEEEHTERKLEGLEMVFIELPKFKPGKYSDKKMQILWLRYLTEIGEKTRVIDEEMLASSEIKQAIDVLEESGYTEAQLEGYDRFWDAVSVERTLISEGEKKGRAEGIAIGEERGIAIGEERKNISNITRMRSKGLDNAAIADFLDLPLEYIQQH